MNKSLAPTIAPAVGDLAARFVAVREFTGTLCETLSPEDCCIQSMPSASPTRWHLCAHELVFRDLSVESRRGVPPVRRAL